jgi:hypothetical protein
MTGEQQRRRLVTDDRLVQGRSVTVGAGEQEAEHACPGVAPAPPRADLVVEAPVQLGPGSQDAGVRSAGAAHHLQRHGEAVKKQGTLEGVREGLLIIARALDPQQRAQRNPQGQPSRPGVEIERLTGHQPLYRRHPLGHHRVSHGEDAIVVKGGNQEPPHPVVEGAVDVEQAVAEQRPQVHEASLPPGEGVGLADQHLVVGGCADRPYHRLGPVADREHGAVAPTVLEQQAERIAERPAHDAEARAQGAGGQTLVPPGAPLGGPVGVELADHSGLYGRGWCRAERATGSLRDRHRA